MKRGLFPSLLCALLLLSLAGCGGRDNDSCLPEELPANRAVEADLTVLRCRVVSVDESSALLAGADAENPDIYTLGADEWTADVPLSAGELVEVTCGGVAESYPAQFDGVRSVTVLSEGFDDRCALYLRVLSDLWDKDAGLNGSGVEYVSVDLSATSLSPAERSAAAWCFAQSHDAEPLELSYEQLCAEGYVSGLEGENVFPAWENGVLFTITETDAPAVFSLPALAEGESEPSMAQFNVKNTVSFDASKWRTALGAYGFSKCVAVQNNDGAWGDYRINGGEWIS